MNVHATGNVTVLLYSATTMMISNTKWSANMVVAAARILIIGLLV